jgi:GNAT superfamily N-acetyltransferase
VTEPIWVFAEYDWDAVHKLLHECFSYMETRIDPPSSLHRLTPQMIADFAADECLFVIEDNQRPIACIFMTEKPDCLYLGKLAVSPKHRGKAYAKILIDRAEQMARDLDLTTLQLETRIELTENHRAFEKMGFHKAAETAHDGYNRPTSITMQKELT